MKRMALPSLTAAILLALGCLLAVPRSALAQRLDGTSPAEVVGPNESVSLTPHLEVLRDPSGQLTIDQVAAPSVTGFTPGGTRTPSFGFTADAVWMRFKVRNPSAEPRSFYVQLALPGADLVDFYAPGATPGAFTVTQTGWERSDTRRPVPSADFVFPATLAGQSEATYYLRLNSDRTAIRLPLMMWDEEAFEANNRILDTLWGVLIGSLFLMAVYNFALFLRLRERNYLLLGLFAAVYSVFSFLTTDMAVAALGLQATALVWTFYPLLAAITQVTFLAFCDSFLDLPKRLPWAHRVSLGVIAATVGAVALVPLGQPTLANIAQVVIGIFITVAVPSFAVWVWRRGYKPAGYFFLAMLFPLFASTVVNLGRLGAGTWEPWYALLSPAGILALIVISSFVMADQINELRRDASRNARRLGEYLDAIPVGVAVYDAAQRPIYVNDATTTLMRSQERPSVNYAVARRRSPSYIAGSDRLYPDEKLPLFQALRGQNASADDLELEVAGKRVALEVWARPLKDEHGDVEAVVSTFLDISERRAREAELAAYRNHLEELVDERTEAERYEREVAQALQETAAALASTLDIEAVVDIILQQLGRVTRYRGAMLSLLEAHELVVVDANGLCSVALSWREPVDAGLPPVAALQAAQERICHQWMPSANGALQAPRMVGVPLINKGQALGVLAVVRDETDPGFADDGHLIRAFADQAATAVTNARLYHQAKLVAAAEEREQLARELHDAVTQTLCSANLLTNTALGLWADAPPAARQPLEDVQWMLTGAVAEMRALLLELRPWALAASPIEAILPPLFEAFTGRTHVPVDLSTDIRKADPLDEDVKIAVYRIAQETLNNIAKHAEAGRVTARLVRHPGHLRLTIADDGRGFDPDAVTSEHMGLDIMRERAEEAHLALTITSGLGCGTKVRVEWNEP